MAAQNAFTSVRPRSADAAPAKAPRKTSTSKAPMEGNAHLALDRNGRRTVSLERKTKGGITIESREQSAASLAAQEKGIAPVTDLRAWGAVFQQAARDGHIRRSEVLLQRQLGNGSLTPGWVVA